jgi:hypothetical protein
VEQLMNQLVQVGGVSGFRAWTPIPGIQAPRLFALSNIIGVITNYQLTNSIVISNWEELSTEYPNTMFVPK